jgi:hypothetical protein
VAELIRGVADVGLWTDDEPPAVVVFCPECAEREFSD